MKTEATDGYSAIQVGFAEKKASRVNKPMAGHFKNPTPMGSILFENLESLMRTVTRWARKSLLKPSLKLATKLTFKEPAKGRGFQGVIKRHGFSGGGSGHGSMFHRAPGSIGCSAYPSRVIKGKKLPGRMGNDSVLRKNVVVVDIRTEENVVLLKGPLPGAKNGLLKIFTKQ